MHPDAIDHAGCAALFDGVVSASLTWASSMSTRARLTTLLVAALMACGGNQQGYYGACDEPAGLALGCDAAPDGDFTPWDACRKLAACGVLWPSVEDDGDMNTQERDFDACVDTVEASEAAQGDLVVTCIEATGCPELAQVDPATTEMMDPNPAAAAIEGIIGYCGRLDPG